MDLALQRMASFKIVTEKTDEYKAYQTLNFCERVLSAYQDEDVSNYNQGFYKLFKWLKLAIEVIKTYITRTKAMAKRDKEDRIKKMDAAEERAKAREQW